MTKVTGYFESTVDFKDKHFLLPEQFVGKVIPFTFKGQHFQIHFPNFDFTPNDRAGDCKVTRRDTRIALNWIEGSGRDSSKYGHASSWNKDGEVTQFSASRLIIRSNKPVLPVEARKAKQNLVEWPERLAAWVEALEYCDLEGSGMYVEQEKEVEAYFIKQNAPKGKGVRRIKRKKAYGANIYLTSRRPLDPKSFRKALRQTDNGGLPPDYYNLLLMGLKHFNEKRYRQSLLDTATAVELALAQILDDRLTMTAPQHKNKLMKQYRQLSGLTLGLTTLGENIPSDLKDKIGTPRNQAIHAGAEVTETKSREALQVAKAFIYARLPLRSSLKKPMRGI